MKTRSYKELLSKYHEENVNKAKQGIAFIGGALVHDEGLEASELNPSAYSFDELLLSFRNLGRSASELGGGEKIHAILFTSSAPFKPKGYGNRADTEIAITDEGECTVTSILYSLDGWADDPMAFFSKVLMTALETTLVDGKQTESTDGVNEQEFKVYTPRGAKLDEENYPDHPFNFFITEAVVGLCGTSPGVTAKTKPYIDEAVEKGEIEEMPFEIELDLLREHMYHPSWDKMWHEQWQAQFDKQMDYLNRCDFYLDYLLNKEPA